MELSNPSIIEYRLRYKLQTRGNVTLFRFIQLTQLILVVCIYFYFFFIIWILIYIHYCTKYKHCRQDFKKMLTGLLGSAPTKTNV